jgi:hypothetical protein
VGRELAVTIKTTVNLDINLEHKDDPAVHIIVGPQIPSESSVTESHKES